MLAAANHEKEEKQEEEEDVAGDENYVAVHSLAPDNSCIQTVDASVAQYLLFNVTQSCEESQSHPKEPVSICDISTLQANEDHQGFRGHPLMRWWI